MDQNTIATTPVENGGEQNNKKGWKIATAIASVVAVCGVGFGVYGMLQSSQKDAQISDLKVQIKDDDGTITTIETPKIETTTTDGATVTISDTVIAPKNLVIKSSDVYGSEGDGYNNVYTLRVSNTIFDNGSVEKSWSVSSMDGDLKCQIRGKNSETIEDCDVSVHDGKVSDLYSVKLGNGIADYILVLTESGELEYLTDTEDNYRVLKKLSLSKKVSRVYSEISNTGVSDGRYFGGGFDALVVYQDGQIESFYHIIHQR